MVAGSRLSVDAEDPVGRTKSRVKTLVNNLVAPLVSMLASLSTLDGNYRQLDSNFLDKLNLRSHWAPNWANPTPTTPDQDIR